MATLNPWINFNGNAEEAFNFYKSVFGGEFSYIGRFKDMPPSTEGPKVSANEENRIMHITLPISKETSLMGSDTGGEWASDFKQGNNITISINADSKSEADKIFNGLSKDGQVRMPMADTFWGSYFGMLTDKFGINWMMSFDAKQPG